MSLLIGILSAMSPEGTFCKIIKSLAETDAWEYFMGSEYDADAWEKVNEVRSLQVCKSEVIFVTEI